VFSGSKWADFIYPSNFDLGNEDKHLIAPSDQSAKLECVREIGTVSQDTEVFFRQMFSGVPRKGPLSQNGKSRSIESLSGRLGKGLSGALRKARGIEIRPFSLSNRSLVIKNSY
jgi:hypothetical protein